MAAYTSVCPVCAEKLSKTRVMHEVGRQRMGSCPLCFRMTAVSAYEVGPSYAELERRRRQARAEDKGRVSGERGRAERRASR